MFKKLCLDVCLAVCSNTCQSEDPGVNKAADAGVPSPVDLATPDDKTPPPPSPTNPSVFGPPEDPADSDEAGVFCF